MARTLQFPNVKGEFVVGLSWRHEDDKPKRKDLIRHSEEKGRWGLVRQTIAGQFQSAYCDPINGKKPAKLISLAALVAEQREQPWMGLYKLADNLYWYVAIRDGHGVIPEGDQIGTEAEVLAVRNRHLDELGEWDEQEGTLEDLARLVESSTRQIKLRDLQSNSWGTAIVAGSALATIVGGGIGCWMYYQHTEKEKAEVVAAQRRAVVSALKARKDAESRILPWTRQAMPSDAFRACRDAWSAQPMTQEGWTLTAWHCGIQQQSIAVDASWDRAGGLADDAPGHMSPDAQHSRSSDTRVVAFPVPSSLAEPIEAASRAAWTLSQRYGFTLSLTAAPLIAPLPGTAAKNDVPVDPWISSPATYTTRVAPWFWFGPAFDAVPGLRVNALEWTLGGGWKVNGALYALRNGAAASTTAPGSKGRALETHPVAAIATPEPSSNSQATNSVQGELTAVAGPVGRSSPGNAVATPSPAQAMPKGPEVKVLAMAPSSAPAAPGTPEQSPQRLQSAQMPAALAAIAEPNAPAAQAPAGKKSAAQQGETW
ncbi:type 4b pilus protein PilO2 [Paraburkholderia sp. SIMBA_054]|uniref:type 4b pilus protein PilO2 n=1 Tax=Paraburkholderia sp. SIMBA_054 TaxID=3085795 RepID=UPI00397E163D